MNNKTRIPLLASFAKFVLHIYPFRRGKGRILKLLVPDKLIWPDCATFSFRYGVFVNTSLAMWPKGYRELFLYGEMESNEVKVWKKVLRKGDIVVDGGANYGYWSLVASTIVGAKGKIHAFEPAPATYERLVENIEKSGATNVQCHQIGLSNKEDTLRLCMIESKEDPIGVQASLNLRPDCEFNHFVDVRVDLLSKLIDHKVPIKLIKLDIEGAELDALKGSKSILDTQNPPVITFEWNRTTANSFNYKPEDVGEYLSEFGYTLFLADQKKGLVPFEDKSVKTGLGSGWIPMVWALTAQHQKELGC